jgi:excisionase family DNA binding protein
MSGHSLTAADDGAALAPLLSINQVARVLGVSRTTVYDLIRDAELVPIRVRERLRFDPADVRAYLERHREAGR